VGVGVGVSVSPRGARTDAFSEAGTVATTRLRLVLTAFESGTWSHVRSYAHSRSVPSVMFARVTARSV
jgi:hypothetical protein